MRWQRTGSIQIPGLSHLWSAFWALGRKQVFAFWLLRRAFLPLATK